MATVPVYSPVVPFLGLIPGGMRPGNMLRIKGHINTYSERLQLNIQSGAALNPRDDTVLHMSIRPSEHAIIRNSMRNQIFEAEERYGGCPIHVGQQFELLILAEAAMFKIAINGAHFCTFNYRLPLSQAQFISISGGCTIMSITTDNDHTPVVPHVPMPAVPSYPMYQPPQGGFVPPSAPPPPYTPSYPSHQQPSYPSHQQPGHGYVPPPPPYPQQQNYPVQFNQELLAQLEKM